MSDYKEGWPWDETVDLDGADVPNPASYAMAASVELVNLSLDLHVEAGRPLDPHTIHTLALTLRWICDRVQLKVLRPSGEVSSMMLGSHTVVRAHLRKSIHSLKADIGGDICRIPWGEPEDAWTEWVERVEGRTSALTQIACAVCAFDVVRNPIPWAERLAPDAAADAA